MTVPDRTVRHRCIMSSFAHDCLQSRRRVFKCVGAKYTTTEGADRKHLCREDRRTTERVVASLTNLYDFLKNVCRINEVAVKFAVFH